MGNNNALNKEQITNLLPHREPMLLIDELVNIVPHKSAVGIINVKKDSFFFQGHFPGQPVMPGVMIVEAFGQAAAALTAYSLNPKEVKDKLVYLMSVDKARFRKPIITPSSITTCPPNGTLFAITTSFPIVQSWAI